MRNTRAHAFLMLTLGVLGACFDAAPGVVTPSALPPATAGSSPKHTLILSDRWHLADVEADFAGRFSVDTTQAGNEATYFIAPYDGDAAWVRTFCRDHFKPIDLWYDGGYGNMLFHLDPPLLFVGYREGTFRSPRGLVFRKAVYESIQPSETVDPDGNVWQFQGRFNALCRGGELEIGPVVFGAQVLVSENPVTRPVLVRRGSGDNDECGGGNGDWYYMESYDPYLPVPETDSGDASIAAYCGSGGGSTFDPADYACTWDYITIEISYDGGQTWQHFWSGWAQVCEEAA
ncbi:MAG TPA: hypothetical protein VF006_03495 [Longimicrobium sp.]